MQSLRIGKLQPVRLELQRQLPGTLFLQRAAGFGAERPATLPLRQLPCQERLQRQLQQLELELPVSPLA
ncbi:MAG: hypothetical protein DSZ00_10825 [Gammaproteobacteria bacterium]|nr:MAG: hypothetical protein DSZ00_10825 [Gammaproteobacteria bacterium]RTZ78083.1 MAG: hypothetical protein DSZ01_05835 [Gammaproteobacteria bacterium]